MDINMVLMNNAHLILEKNREGEDFRLKYTELKHRIEMMEGQLILSEKTRNNKVTQVELKALVDTDEEIYELKMELIKLESSYRRLFKEAEALDEELKSAKILARSELNHN